MGSADHTSTNMYTPHLSLLVPVLLLLAPPHHVQGYSSGAPVGQCDSMLPLHKTEPMDPTTSPYTIQVASVKMFNSETLNVSLISDTGEYFEGFLLKAVSIDDGKTVGTFNILNTTNATIVDAEYIEDGSSNESNESEESNESDESNESVESSIETGEEDNGSVAVKYLKCSGLKSAVTHSNGSAKTSLYVQWVPPSSYEGSVRLVATVVKEYNTFWVNITSATVQVVRQEI